MDDEILCVENLKKYYSAKKRPWGPETVTARAADGVSFTVRRGEVFVIAGESGSGKSTIAKMILGSVRPDAGRILFEGDEVKYGQKSMRRIRTGCQMIHQDPYDSINPRMRVSEIIEEPLGIHDVYGSSEERKNRVMEVLGEVRLEPAAEIASKYPHMLSGGQRQRIVLARALALKPRIIIADEPVSMLDVSIRAEMLELMRELQSRYGISFVYITHDLATAKSFGQRIGILYKGAMVETGAIRDVLLRPRHPYTQALIDAVPEPDPENLHRKKIIRIVGENAGDGNPNATVINTHQLQNDSGDVKSSSSFEYGHSDTVVGCRFAPRCPYAADVCSVEPALEQKDKDTGHLAACHVDIAAKM